MNQKILNIIVLALFIVQPIFSQKSYRIKYELNFQIDSTDSKNSNTEIMYLDINKNKESYFQSESKFLKDSILLSENPYSLLKLSKPNFFYRIKKEYNTNQLQTYYNYTAFKFILNDTTNLNWKITNDPSKEILGYKANKALVSFRGRDYIAWFTNDISIPDGPYKFSGLPGLILEIYDTEKEYHFKAFSIQELPSNYKSYLVQDDYKLITQKEFNEFKDKVKEKPSLVLYNPGIKIPKEGLDGYDKKHRERNKHKNNPIELTNE